MKATRIVIPLVAVVLACAADLRSQPADAPQWNVQTYAQSLVSAVAESHPELAKAGLYAMPPGSSIYVMAASTSRYKVGKRADADDLAIINGQTLCAKRPRKVVDVGLPLSDSAGNLLGCLTMEVNFSFTEDPAVALKLATQIRDDLAKMIRSREELFSEAEPSRPDDIYAQRLIDHVAARHPELNTIGIHVTPPGGSANIIIASTSRIKIGKKSDPDDLDVMKPGAKPVVEIHDNKQIVDTGLPLFDAGGQVIGTVVMEVKDSFLQGPGDVKPASSKDMEAALKLATRVRDEISKRIQSTEQLFSTAAP